MVIQPKIHSFILNPVDGDAPAKLHVTITVSDGVVAATILAHITAIVDQYQNVQRQVEQAAPAPAPAPASEPVREMSEPTATVQPAMALAKTTARKMPTKKAAPPATPEDVTTAEAAHKAGLIVVPDSPPAAPPIAEESPASVSTGAAPAVLSQGDPAVPDAEVVEPNGGGQTCPPELASAPSFRKVLEWMIAHDYRTADMIVSKCEEYADSCPPIARAVTAVGGLTDRVTRGLDVVLRMGAIA